MQFHQSTPPRSVRIRRIPTIRLQTMKHPRRNCMRNCDAGAEACCGTRGWRKGQAPRKVARNSIEQSFNKVRKRCNSNDLNSMFEIVAGELRAKLGMASATPQARAEHDTRAVGHGRGAGGRWRGRRDLPRCRWAVAGPGRASRRRAEQHQRPGATGVEGTGETRGPGCGARGRQRSQARLVTAT